MTISARVYATRRATSIPSAAAFSSAPNVLLTTLLCFRLKKSIVLHKQEGSGKKSSAQAMIEPHGQTCKVFSTECGVVATKDLEELCREKTQETRLAFAPPNNTAETKHVRNTWFLGVLL